MKTTNPAGMEERADRKLDVAVIGEINVDLILQGNVDPAFGQVEKIVEQAALTIGSSAAIFACGSARLGLKTAFIGTAGADAFGNFMLEAFHARGIETGGVHINPALDTGFSVILAKETDRAILTYPGSIPELRYTDIDFSILASSRHLHLGSFFMLDKLRPDIPKLFRRARELGLSISLDTNFDPEEKWDGGLKGVIPLVDVILPNAREVKSITGEDDLERAVARLNEVVPYVVVKLGEDGAMVKKRGEPLLRQEAVRVDVVDTVGAGDSFDAGFICGYLNGMSLGDTLKLAVVCGSLSTRGAGGTNAQPDRDEALAAVRQLN